MQILRFSLLVVLIFLILSLSLFEIADPDVFNYLAFGRYIKENGLIRSCVFTFPLSDCIMTYSEWLWQVLLYQIYIYGQWWAMVLFQAIVVLATFLFVFFSASLRRVSLISTSVILLFAALAASERFMLRADTFSLLTFAAVYFSVSLLINQDFFPGKRKLRYLCWFFIFTTQVLWANTHGSFPLAFLIVFSFVFPQTVRFFVLKLKKKEEKVGQNLKYLFLTVFFLIIASLINPYGSKAFLWPFVNTLSTVGNEIAGTIYEYTSPYAKGDLVPVTVRSYQILNIFALFLFLFNFKKIKIPDFLLLLPVFLLSLQAIRYIGYLSLFYAFVLPFYLENVLAFVQKFLPKKSEMILSLCLLAVIVYLIPQIITNKFYLADRRIRRFGLGVNKLLYPFEASDFVKKEKIAGNMFNSFGFGGFLNFRLYPYYKTFIHQAVLDPGLEQTVRLYKYSYQVNFGKISPDKLVDDYDVNFFFLNHIDEVTKNLLFTLYNDPKWKIVYADQTAIIFLADKKENEPIIKKFAFDLAQTSPFDLIKTDGLTRKEDILFVYSGVGTLYFKLKLYKQALPVFEKMLTLTDTPLELYSIYNNLGSVYNELGRTDEAIEALRKAINIRPDFAVLHFNLAQAYLKKKNYEEAKKEYFKALRLNETLAQVSYKLALLYLREGKIDDAKKYYQHEIKKNPLFVPKKEELEMLGL